MNRQSSVLCRLVVYVEVWRLKSEKKKGKTRKEMTITLKSKPKASDSARSDQFVPDWKQKRRDTKQKGTRGPSWIG